MIRHIVMFRLKDARPDKVEAAAQMLRSMKGCWSWRSVRISAVPNALIIWH